MWCCIRKEKVKGAMENGICADDVPVHGLLNVLHSNKIIYVLDLH